MWVKVILLMLSIFLYMLSVCINNEQIVNINNLTQVIHKTNVDNVD